MPIQLKENHEDGAAVVLDIEGRDCELQSNPKSIGWNISTEPEDLTNLNPPNFFAEVQESHKQITDRFVELLNLFEDYSKIMESEQAHFRQPPKLKRSQSEQFTVAHIKQEPDSSELLKTTVSLNRMQLSDCTLLGIPRKITCEAGCQTSWNVLPDKDDKKPVLNVFEKPKKLELQQPPISNQNPNTNTNPNPNPSPNQSPNQHTLHIEVESISSTTALLRAPLGQRLWQMLVDAWQSLLACFYMMGENITYVLFVLLCMWCLYLIISHYYSFLGSQKIDVKKTLTRS